MNRSKWKGSFLSRFLIKKESQFSKIWTRNSVIPAKLLGLYVSIYNGQIFKKVLITQEKIGFKFGDFVLTRKYISKFKQKKN
jgi:ribosomal protein S19|tara:strand:+ start:200 stop:445 length:246 start_codon:yes stop_codon:yes gene_type:complete